MKYKSVIFAVHTDGKKPFVSDDIMGLCYSAFFAYDTEKMACICFVILEESFNENSIRENVPFYMGYEIDTEKYKKEYAINDKFLKMLNGELQNTFDKIGVE